MIVGWAIKNGYLCTLDREDEDDWTAITDEQSMGGHALLQLRRRDRWSANRPHLFRSRKQAMAEAIAWFPDQTFAWQRIDDDFYTAKLPNHTAYVRSWLLPPWWKLDDSQGRNRQAKSVVEDVMRIKRHPLVPNDIRFTAISTDVKSGKLMEVQEATTAGKLN
jgi:hypothetical protein